MRFELSRGASRGQTRGGRGGRGGRGWNNSERYFQNDVNRRQAQDNRFKNRYSVYGSSDDDAFVNDWGDDGYETVRQRVCSGGRSSSELSKEIETFENMSSEALFTKLSTTEVKVDSIYSSLPDRLLKAESVIKSHNNRIKLLECKSIDLEARSRRRNLVFRGLGKDEQGENCFGLVRNCIYDDLCIDDDMYLERAHRLGPRNIGRRKSVRPIIVAFRDYYDTEIIMYRLQGKDIAVTRDYPQEISKARKTLWYQYKEARRDGNNRVQIKYTARLVVNGATLRDCFPDWNDVMKQRRAYISRVPAVDISDTKEEYDYFSPRQDVMGHSAGSQARPEPTKGPSDQNDQRTQSTNGSLSASESTRDTNNADALLSLSQQIQSQRTRSRSRLRDRSTSLNRTETGKGSASRVTSPSEKGSQDTGPKSIPMACSSGNKPSSAPNVNDNDRTATNDNAMKGKR